MATVIIWQKLATFALILWPRQKKTFLKPKNPKFWVSVSNVAPFPFGAYISKFLLARDNDW